MRRVYDADQVERFLAETTHRYAKASGPIGMGMLAELNRMTKWFYQAAESKKMVKQIKTIQKRTYYHKEFDEEVNELLREGWTLKKRIRTSPFPGNTMTYEPMYVAYLEKEVEVDEEKT